MLTGTPLDLTPFGSVLTGIGVVYWLLAFGALIVAVKVPKSRRGKLFAALVVLCIFGYLPASGIVRTYVARNTLAEATAHFEMRCKTAGEKITRSVENVDGVAWMKWRDKRDVKDDYDQFKLSDPYGRDCHAEECIEQLLRATKGLNLDPSRKEPFHTGYRFVESVDPTTKQLHRYTRQLYRPHDREAKYTETLVRAELVPEVIKERTARYGITWEDISTREDRERWIAGGSLKVIDLQSKEVIGERIGFMMDRALGSRDGFRSPWLAAPAFACPPFPKATGGGPFMSNRNQQFIFKVLRPIEEK